MHTEHACNNEWRYVGVQAPAGTLPCLRPHKRASTPEFGSHALRKATSVQHIANETTPCNASLNHITRTSFLLGRVAPFTRTDLDLAGWWF